MKYCQNCGNQIDDMAVVCVRCGVAVTTPVQQPQAAPQVTIPPQAVQQPAPQIKTPLSKSAFIMKLLLIIMSAAGIALSFLCFINNNVGFTDFDYEDIESVRVFLKLPLLAASIVTIAFLVICLLIVIRLRKAANPVPEFTPEQPVVVAEAEEGSTEDAAPSEQINTEVKQS